MTNEEKASKALLISQYIRKVVAAPVALGEFDEILDAVYLTFFDNSYSQLPKEAQTGYFMRKAERLLDSLVTIAKKDHLEPCKDCGEKHHNFKTEHHNETIH